MTHSGTVSYMNNIVGHKPTIKILRQALCNARLPHALLFSGPPAVGKQTAARAFAADCVMAFGDKSMDLEYKSNFEKLFKAGNYPDFHSLSVQEGKKDISVEQVRVLCQELQLKSYYSSRKVAVINNAHRMSIAACNSLLMTLEEPPPETYIILVSEASHRLPQTIVSRCQVVHFGYLALDSVRNILTSLLQECRVNQSLVGLVERLAKITDGTLAPLCLEEFIDPKTLGISDLSGLEKHLSNIDVKSGHLHRQLMQFSTGTDSAVSLASSFAKDKDISDILWPMLRKFVRRNLMHSSYEALPKWADSLVRLLEAEKLVKERNANLDLQLSSLLLDMVEARKSA